MLKTQSLTLKNNNSARVYNFGAGPATLPEEILLQAKEELLNWQNTGMSVIEISHRSAEFSELVKKTEQDFRDLLAIPKDYRVLFLSAPARAQFAMIPMNLLRGKKQADYIETGVWSHLAIEEAKRYTTVNVAASSAASHYNKVPDQTSWHINKEAAYVYFTHNETIDGVIFPMVPQIENVPLVSDMTSSLLTQPLDISQYGLVFAGSQKNIGPAGLTIVVVRDDLLGDVLPITPSIFNYQLLAQYESLYYTPTSFTLYMAGLMFSWLKSQGGINEMWQRNQRKAQTLYRCIDSSDFYLNSVLPAYRSPCNVPFKLSKENLTPIFLEEARQANLAGIQGHRLLGGLRASLYNAMPQAGVDALVEFMQDFKKKYA